MSPRGTTTVIIFCLAGSFITAWLTNRRPDNDLTANHTVLQDRANNCGAAALKMVIEHFGRIVSQSDLENKLALSSAGTSLQRIKEVGENFGLQAHGWKLRQEDLEHVQYPIIMFWKRKHFVVADSLDAFGNLSVRDPAVGSVRIQRETLQDIWSGEAVSFSSRRTAETGRNRIVKKD
jgi:ABC-type bacteriocin/lantibiotic exporter with double-glycine peptidase domain